MRKIDRLWRQSPRGLPGVSSLLSGRWAVAARCVGVTMMVAALSPAAAQIVVTSRNGGNVVYCGVPGGGPLINHQFLTPAATDDAIAVSDPGDAHRPATSATAHLVASGSPGQVSISVTGSSQRGSPRDQGAYATADGRDTWNFTVAAPKPFRLVVSLTAASTDATFPVQGFNFFSSGGGGLELSNGSTVGGPGQALTAPGSWTMTYSGTIRAGSYSMGLSGRSEGNASPFLGSFDHSVQLRVGCPADFDGDGFVTGDDFDSYVAAFESGAAASDFDGDGFVTGDDFDGYVVAFENGC